MGPISSVNWVGSYIYSSVSKTSFLEVMWGAAGIRSVSLRMQVGSLASLSELRIRRCRELWCRSPMWLRPSLLWPWHRPAVVVLIQLLAWELPCAAQKRKKKKKKWRQQKKTLSFFADPNDKSVSAFPKIFRTLDLRSCEVGSLS